MIKTSNITKSFGSLQVLKGIDLNVEKSQIVSIVGPSGAGKTTLLQIIGTLDRPDTGSIIIDGIDVTTLNQRQLTHRFRVPIPSVAARVHRHREHHDSCLHCRT